MKEPAMRDIVLSMLAIALVAGAGLAALPAADGTMKTVDKLHQQADRDRANGTELQTWAERMER